MFMIIGALSLKVEVVLPVKQGLKLISVKVIDLRAESLKWYFQ